MNIHINAKKEDIADVVLMPGDPLRAKYIASKYLDKAEEVTNVRNILGYTGFYKNKRVTVMASGMGISSIGIYAHELFVDYDVKTIIRLGTCGAYNESLRLKDVIVVNKAYTDSNFAYNFNSVKTDVALASDEVMHKLIKSANDNKVSVKSGNILTSEVFYRRNDAYQKYVLENNVLGVEMESFALFYLANVLGKESGCILTVSDCVFPNDYGILTSQEKESSLDSMILIALESIL